VIFVDTSAMIAILAAEPDAPMFAAKLDADRDRITGAHVILETAMRLATISGLEPTAADAELMRALHEANIAVVPIDEEIAHGAVTAFERYGKGRKHRASLTFGDCLSYACAKAHGAKLLFKGDGFAHTDVAKA
jgi:ribonuclease VapC